jgi:hypothetical protein
MSLSEFRPLPTPALWEALYLLPRKSVQTGQLPEGLDVPIFCVGGDRGLSTRRHRGSATKNARRQKEITAKYITAAQPLAAPSEPSISGRHQFESAESISSHLLQWLPQRQRQRSLLRSCRFRCLLDYRRLLRSRRQSQRSLLDCLCTPRPRASILPRHRWRDTLSSSLPLLLVVPRQWIVVPYPAGREAHGSNGEDHPRHVERLLHASDEFGTGRSHLTGIEA